MAFALCGCKKEELSDLPEPAYGCKLHITDSNIIAGISRHQDSLIFILENQERIVRSTGCITECTIDTGNWAVNLVYENSAVQSLPFLGNSFVINEDSILINPYERAPLTALVKFNLPVPGRIKIKVHGRSEDSPDINHIFDDYKTSHVIPVFGLYADYDNTVTISVLDYFGNERISRNIHLQTEALSYVQSGDMEVNINKYAGEQKERFFSIQNAVYDAGGYIRWTCTEKGQKYFSLANHLMAIQLWGDKGDPAPEIIDIRIINMFGQRVDTFNVPNRNHHEISEKSPGGNLLVATNAEPYFDIDDDTEDAIVEIDRRTGEVIEMWDLRYIFDPTRERLRTEMPNDWCHLNSIEYDPSDNTLLISSRLQYFIAKIDYNTGQIKWIFGNHENWKEPWQEYLLTPLNFDTLTDPDHDWVYDQHMARLTENGNVLVYDNGKSRPGGAYTRALEFRVDEANMTVRKTWTYNSHFATRTMGSVHIFDNGNVLIGHGEKGNIIEVTREGEVVFDANMKKRYFYRAYPFEFY